MTFNSLQFAIFFALVLVTYWRIPRRLQNLFLLGASYFFYGWWDWRFLGLLVLSTVLDFTIARLIHEAGEEARRKRLLGVSVAVNLGILAIFKYRGFFVDSFYDLLGNLGVDGASPVIDVLLPVGISFYTFQTISYSFDVYRRRIEPTTSLVNFALYVAYFPQLVAGPIERAHHLLPRIERANRQPPRPAAARHAWTLIVLGLFKKVVIADGAAGVVSSVFDDPSSHSAPALVVGVLAFAVQIYGDFSGYTDIARGVSKLLGIDLVVNFRQPYLSRSITEFWRRWHISLSTWLRDYLYIPLGGNRGSAATTMRNVMLTMLLGGLWHGAAWNFVIWGGLHGVFLAVDRLVSDGWVNDRDATFSDSPRILGTFALTCFAWVFFRADTFGEAIDVIAGIVTLSGGRFDAADALLVVVLAGLVLGIDLGERRSARETRHATPQWALGVAVGLFGILLFSGGVPEPFVYFQF